MRILTVCSTINLRDFTRRATIEAIKEEFGNLDVVFYTSIKNLFKRKISVTNIHFSTYHFWIPDKMKKFIFLNHLEHILRSWFWRKKISEYNWVFFTDPNQAWLLPYINKSKIIYLIRDPNILQNINQQENERNLLNCSDLVLATSKNLTDIYLKKYYGLNNKNIHYWPNCVDLNIWKFEKTELKTLKKPVIGVAGNFSKKRTDYSLLEFITSDNPDLDFEIGGKIDYNESKAFWDNMFLRTNVRYLGIIPFEQLPAIVSKWDVGLVTDKMDEYASYMHHNKVYQYLAMGVPVVSLKIHEDYMPLSPFVHLAETYEQFAEGIRSFLEESYKESFRISCVAMARLNSSDIRAKAFISLIETI